MTSLEDFKKIKKNALIIVAHPDDESLFMGGTIAEFKKWRWTVLCVTDCDKRYNRRRRYELVAACAIYNENGSHVKPAMLGMAMKKPLFLKGEIADRIRDFIGRFGPFDFVFTHNSKGDYGHKTHRLIHHIVKKLGFSDLYTFYTPPFLKSILVEPHGFTAVAPFSSSILIGTGAWVKNRKSIQIVKLSPKSLIAKREALNIYLKGSQKTNLSKLKRLLKYTLNTRVELFYNIN